MKPTTRPSLRALLVFFTLPVSNVFAAESGAPALTVPPASLTEVVGNNVALSVSAVGAAPLRYQWNFSGTPIVGATSDLLFLPRLQPATAGNYTVTVSNSLGSVTSSAATLTVIATRPEPVPLVDASFAPALERSNGTRALHLLPNGKILITGGSFLLTRLNADGTLDSAFTRLAAPFASSANPASALNVSSLLRQADGLLIVAGGFNYPDPSTLPLSQSYLARFHADGTRDASFTPDATLPAEEIAQALLQPDGRILLVNNTDRLLRLNSDGSLDRAFVTPDLAIYFESWYGLPPTISRCALDATGRIIVALSRGAAFNVTPQTSLLVLRLRSDGTLDPSFTPTVAGTETPRMLHVLDDGRILVTSDMIIGRSGSWILNRLKPDGGIDPSFPVSSGSFIQSGSVRSAVDSAGRIVIVPTQHSGLSWLAPRRVLADGTPDPTLVHRTPLLDGFFSGDWPDDVAVLPDGRALIANQGGLTRLLAANVTPTHPPRLITAPSSAPLTVAGGETLTLPLTLAGTGPFTYTWETVPADPARAAIPPRTLATDEPLTLESVRLNGTYTATIRNPAGTVTTAPLAIAVTPRAPAIAPPPTTAVTVRPGGLAVLSAHIAGSGAVRYQWFHNDQPLADPQLALPGPVVLSVHATPDQLGTYRLVATSPLGTATGATITVTSDDTPRLANVSTRASVGTGERVLIAGFKIGGTAAKRVLLRAIGPRLDYFNVPGFVADPTLTLFDATGQVIDRNDDATAEVTSTNFGDGIFPLAPGSRDAAFIARLAPGSYTLHIAAKDNTPGIALAEVYEDANDTGHLTNLSTRAFVDTGAQLAIAGIIVSGTTSKKLLLRAVGPGLAAFGVTGFLADPAVTVMNQSGAIINGNDNWLATPDLAAATTAVGAFPLAAGSKDAALVLSLPPGAYTCLVRGASDTSGTALVEVYEVP